MADIDALYHGPISGTKAQVTNTVENIANMVILNLEAAPTYLQIFYKLATAVTVGTTVPDLVIPLPVSGGVSIPFSKTGWKTRGTGITLASTTTATGSSTAATYVTIWRVR